MSDPIERALGSLRRREHPRTRRDAPLDATVALALQRRESATPKRRPRVFLVAAVVLIAAAGFGAATNADVVRRWLVVIHLLDGEVESEGAPVEELPSGPGGRDLRIDLGGGSDAEIRLLDPDGGGERKMEVELHGEGRGPGRIELRPPKTETKKDQN